MGDLLYVFPNLFWLALQCEGSVLSFLALGQPASLHLAWPVRLPVPSSSQLTAPFVQCGFTIKCSHISASLTANYTALQATGSPVDFLRSTPFGLPFLFRGNGKMIINVVRSYN
ncbi:hypothetical protein QBC35DRAFT_133024 [Podospora australis]|uniref:Uncharacterized protein n=1 Tax=Podospora australis TaxID=1536484 RepID=A0AAN6WX78_9PEZI|nr:hypothetical protein QBC35DRAFT_133024 [Podospora australis]